MVYREGDGNREHLRESVSNTATDIFNLLSRELSFLTT